MLCDYNKNQYLIPTLLNNLSIQDQIQQQNIVKNKWESSIFHNNNTKVVEASINLKVLIPGLFEKLSCLCILDYSTNHKNKLEPLIAPGAVLYYTRKTISNLHYITRE